MIKKTSSYDKKPRVMIKKVSSNVETIHYILEEARICVIAASRQHANNN